MSITVSVARAVMIAALAVGLVFGSLGRGAWEEFESSRAVTRAVEHPEWVAAEVVALSFSDEALGEAAKAYATEEVSPEELRGILEILQPRLNELLKAELLKLSPGALVAALRSRQGLAPHDAALLRASVAFERELNTYLQGKVAQEVIEAAVATGDISISAP